MSRADRIFVVHQSPLIDDKGVQYYVTEVTLEDLERYGAKLLGLIRQGIEAVIKLLKHENVGFRLCHDLKGVDLAICLLEKMSDAISIAMRRFFIVPLVPLPLVDEVKEVPPTPQDILYAWVLGRGIPIIDAIMNKSLRELDYEDLKNIVNNIVINLGDIVKPPRDEKQALERLELLVNLPSDTRPGCSISKLIPHLLTTAGLAIAKYISKYGTAMSIPRYRLSLALLRLAALLHDVGKPYAWVKTYRSGKLYSHASESATLLEVLGIKKVLEEHGLGDLYEALKILIDKHHNVRDLPEKYLIESLGIDLDLRDLGAILREADRDSSDIDRLSKHFVEMVGKLVEEYAHSYGLSVEEMFVGIGPAVWNAWLSMPIDRLREIANTISHSFRARIVPPKLVEELSEAIENVKLLVIDLAEIQRFIKRESLRILTAASFIIDLCTVYAIPRAIIEVLGLAIDSIVYAGGGFVIAIVPATTEDKAIEKLVEKVRQLTGFAMTLNYALVDLERSWPRSMRKAIAMLAARKSLFKAYKVPIETGYEVLCEYCGRRPATQKLEPYKELVCDECQALHAFGSSMYVRTRLRMLAVYGYEKAREILERELLETVYQYLMPWLSGVELNALHREQYRVAVVKADGNAAGQYISSAINVAEAMCRSIRIDMGLKLGFLSALSKLKEKLSEEFEELAMRLFVGTLYAGGDDMLAIWPAHVAIPIAISIAKTFWRINGGELQLSIAIAAAKPKHNIWNTLDAAEYMLKTCKDRYREALARELGSKLIAVLSLVKGEWQLFEAEVEEILRRYRARELSYQPLFLSIERTSTSKPIACSDLWVLIQECFGEALGIDVASVDTLVDTLYSLYRERDTVKKLVEVIHEAMNVGQAHAMDKYVMALYLARSTQRVRDEVEQRIRKGLAKLSLICSGLPPLFDLYHLAEIYERR